MSAQSGRVSVGGAFGAEIGVGGRSDVRQQAAGQTQPRGSRIVADLVSLNLVRRQACQSDGRRSILRLTNKGEELLDDPFVRDQLVRFAIEAQGQSLTFYPAGADRRQALAQHRQRDAEADRLAHFVERVQRGGTV